VGEEMEVEKSVDVGVENHAVVVESVDKVDETGGTEMLEIQPLAIMGAGENHSVSPDWC
jgi:hypothetical protein